MISRNDENSQDYVELGKHGEAVPRYDSLGATRFFECVNQKQIRDFKDDVQNNKVEQAEGIEGA